MVHSVPLVHGLPVSKPARRFWVVAPAPQLPIDVFYMRLLRAAAGVDPFYDLALPDWPSLRQYGTPSPPLHNRYRLATGN